MYILGLHDTVESLPAIKIGRTEGPGPYSGMRSTATENHEKGKESGVDKQMQAYYPAQVR